MFFEETPRQAQSKRLLWLQISRYTHAIKFTSYAHAWLWMCFIMCGIRKVLSTVFKWLEKHYFNESRKANRKTFFWQIDLLSKCLSEHHEIDIKNLISLRRMIAFIQFPNLISFAFTPGNVILIFYWFLTMLHPSSEAFKSLFRFGIVLHDSPSTRNAGCDDRVLMLSHLSLKVFFFTHTGSWVGCERKWKLCE